MRFLSDEERRRLLKACQASSNCYLYPVVVLALSTGMRYVEIMRLTWSCIDLDMARVVLHDVSFPESRTGEK